MNAFQLAIISTNSNKANERAATGMPRLDRLLRREPVDGHSTIATAAADELQDATAELQDVTAEQLFSESLLSQRLLQVRKQAAAICAAKPIRMSALLEGNVRYIYTVYIHLGVDMRGNNVFTIDCTRL